MTSSRTCFARKALLAFAALVLLPSLAFAQARPAGQRPPINTVEASIWDLSDKAEIDAKRAGQLITDPALNAYINGVRCKVASEYCGDMRVYLMARPAFNASMAPNGYMEVWSGLLLRAENEAQLAFVIAHEAGHFQENHSIEAWRNMRSRSNWAMALSIVAGAAGAPSYVGDLIYLGAIATVFGFSRESETQADVIGFQRAIAAGYDPAQGGELWRLLIGEAAASQFPDIRRREARSGIFNTHPVSVARASSLDAMSRLAIEAQTANAVTPKTWIVGRETHRAAIRPFIGAWLRDELRRRDYGQTLDLIKRLKNQGTDLGVLTFYEAELFRLRRKAGDLELALATYQAASAFPDAPADTWRELGDAHLRSGKNGEAMAALQTYLLKSPSASDKELIMARLDRMGAMN